MRKGKPNRASAPPLNGPGKRRPPLHGAPGSQGRPQPPRGKPWKTSAKSGQRGR